MELTVKPMGNRLLVKPVNIERISDGGIIQAGLSNSETMNASVVAIGDGVEKPDEFYVGQIVHFGAMSLQRIMCAGPEHGVVNADAILAVEDTSTVRIVSREEAEKINEKPTLYGGDGKLVT